jgi:thiol-disulfide isomerase/thioredoxin
VILHKGESGYESYISSLKKATEPHLKKRIKSAMINKPFNSFALKDLNGNRFDLKELRGKIVVIDFWATWCQPCKDAFPGLKAVVEQYHEDKSVKFLFIDTWENLKNPESSIQSFMVQNNYPFTVLLDDYDSNGKHRVIAKQLDVNALPTQIIVGKDGMIKFKDEGYPGTLQQLQQELTIKIEMLKN